MNRIFLALALILAPLAHAVETGTANQVLRYPSSAPAGTRPKYGAVNIASSAAVTGTLGATNGGTGVASFSTGALLYGSGSNAWSALAAGSQGQFLRMGSSTPAWGFPNVVAKTGAYTATAADDVILASGAAFTITLPTAVGITGKQYYVKKTDSTIANIITVGTTSAQTIDGATTVTLKTQYATVGVVSDGANWQLLDQPLYTIAAKYNSSGTSATNSSTTVLVFSTKEYDTTNSFNTSTGVYTVPIAGTYQVCAYFQASGATGTGAVNDVETMRVQKNSADVSYMAFFTAQTTTALTRNLNGCSSVSAAVNDTLDVAINNPDSTFIGVNNAQGTWVSFLRVGN